MKLSQGSRSDVSLEYQYKVIAYVAATLTQNSSIKDFVIYSNSIYFREFDDLVLKLWLKEERDPYVYLMHIKHRSRKLIKIGEKLTKFEESFINILKNGHNIRILQDVPAANIKCCFFCNNDVQENTQTLTKSIYNFIRLNESDNTTVPFKFLTGSCYQIRLSLTQAHSNFLDKFNLFLNMPNINEIERCVAKMCDIVDSTDITDYVYEYYKVPYLFSCGLTKTNFEIELLKIHLRNYIVKPTIIIDVNEEQAHIWNKITIEHQLTIVDNVPDIRRILFGCFVYKINQLFQHDLKWNDCLYKEGMLDDVTFGKAGDFFAKNNLFLQWLSPPQTIRSLIDCLWLCNELPLILKIHEPPSILDKYKHLNKRFLLINEFSMPFEKIASSFSSVFTSMADIHTDSLRNEFLQNIIISLQGRTPVRLYDIIGSDQNCMTTLRSSDILHLIKKRKIYLEKRCLNETESTVFIIQDENLNTDKNSNIWEANDDDTIVINCKSEEREWYIKQIEENPKYKLHSICCLRSVHGMLEFIEGDMHALRWYFIDNWGGYIYCVEKDRPIPIIGQRLDSKPQVYIPRYLRKAIIPNSVFKTQERRICFLSGDIDSLEYDIKEQFLKEDIDYNTKILLENNQNVLIDDKILSPSEYWEKFSNLNCPLFHVKVVAGCMELVNYKNCLNMSSYISYSKESFIEDIFCKEINSKIIVISGEPGIGKSSLLHSLSEAMDAKNYILFCNLADYRRDLTLDNENLFEEPLDFIFNKFKKPPDKGLPYSLYKYHKNNGRVTLFIDSFDELLPMHKKSLLCFMQSVAKFNIQIIVASRLFLDTMLINNFEVQPLKLDTLKEVDYAMYLKCKGMINMHLDDIPNEFLTSPLFLTFLWFFYREGVLDFTRISQFDLFKKIIMKKVERYYQKTKLRFDPEVKALSNDVLRMHREVALVVVFGKDLVINQKLITNYDKLLVSFKALKMRLGIVKNFEGDYAVFLHQTISEFLAAEWLYEKLLDGDFDLPTQTIYKKMLLECDVKVRYLFDSMICAKLRLHKAILEGNLGLVEQLANKDERNLTQIDKCGRNALILAASYCYDKNYEILEEVVAKSHACGIDFFKCDFFMKWNWVQYLDRLSKDRFFDQACNYNLPATIAKYLSYKEKIIGLEHISSAYQNNNLDIVLALLVANSSLLAELFVPLMKNAIDRGRLDVACDLIVLKYKCNIFDVLVSLSNSAYVQEFVKTQTCSEFTALHLACMLGNRKVTKALLDKNADVYGKDVVGNVPLHYAIIHGKVDMFTRYFITGVAKEQTANTFLHLACRFLKKEIVELLLFHRIVPANERNSKGETPLHAIACMNCQQIIENEVRNLTNALVENFLTSFNKEQHMFNKILGRAQRDAKVEHMVSDAFHKNVIVLMDILLNFGLDAMEKDKKGNTALHLAYQHKNRIVLEYLIKKFEKIAFIKGAKGLSVFEIAKRDGKMDIVNYIRQQTFKPTQDRDTEPDYILSEFEERSIRSELRYTGEKGRTFLHTAAINGRSDIILLLLEKGFSADVRDDEGYTPLHFAKSARDAQLFLGRFNNIKEAFPITNTGETPFCTACRSGYVDIVRFLLSQNIDLLKSRNKYGQTPLHLSAMANNLEVAVILLGYGANVNDTDTNKATALHLVIPNGSTSFAETLLVNDANIYLQDNLGNTALHLACLYGRTKLAERLIKESPKTIDICNAEGHKPYDIACIEGKYNVLDLVIKHLPTNKEFKIASTILCKIIKMGHLGVLEILSEMDIIDLECRDDEGNSLLHLASLKDHSHIMCLLLKGGLKPNILNDNLETPLHLVQSVECAELLLSKYHSGSKAFTKTKFDETPLHGAACVSADLVQILLNAKADVSSKDSFGWTPLHIAAWANKLDVIQVLLKNGANVNETNDDSSTALHIAATRNVPLVKVLLNSGADINAINKCELRLQRNPNIKLRSGKNELVEDGCSETALDIACMHGKYDIVEYLVSNHVGVKTFNVSETTFRKVISTGDLRCLKILFNRQILPKDYIEYSNRLEYLHIAVVFGHEDVISFLIDQSDWLAKINIEIKSPYMYAIVKNYVGIVTALLEKTAKSIREEHCLINLILSNNIELNKTADVVHAFLRYGFPPILDILVKDETDFDNKDVDGYNSLEYIFLFTNHSKITYLVNRYPCLRKCAISKNVFLKLLKDRDLVALEILFRNNDNLRMNNDNLKLKDENGCTALHLAVMAKHKGLVAVLIEKGSNIDAVNNQSVTSLHLAATTDNKDIVQLLLKSGAHVNATNIDFKTALHIAAEREFYGVLEILLDYNADMELLNNNGVTALHIAVIQNNIHTVKVLLKRGANVNTTSIDFREALCIAASGNLLPILEMLSEYTAMIQSSAKNDVMALKNTIEVLIERCVSVDESKTHRNLAASKNLSSILHLLLNCDFNIVKADRDGKTTSNFKLMKDNTSIKQLLLQKCAEVNPVFINFTNNAETQSEIVNGQTALHLAVSKDDLSITEILLDYKADINLADLNGRTALHYAVIKYYEYMNRRLMRKGLKVNGPVNDLLTNSRWGVSRKLPSITDVLLDYNADFQSAGRIDDYNIIPILLQRGANVNATAIIFGTVLHIAALKNMPSVLKLLLNFEANLQLTDDYGNTPLHLAYAKGNIRVIELLTKHSANLISIRNLDGYTPFEFACINGSNYGLSILLKCIPLIKTENISIDALHSIVERGLLATLQLIFDKDVINKDDLEKSGKFKRFLLHIATTNDHVDIVHFLIKKGVKVNPSDIDGLTPLHLARSVDTAKILINNYKNIDNVHEISHSGRTPLHTASGNGFVEVIKLLLDAGAELTVRDTCGWTPLLLATYKNQDPCVKILLNSGANVNEMNNCNETALHLAVQNGNWTLVNVLLEKGADVHIKDWNGNTILHSIMNMYRFYTWFIESPLYNCQIPSNNIIDLVQLLIEHTIDLNEINGDQERAIEIVKNLKLEKLPDLERVESNVSTAN